ncbi:peptidase inhibitor family I36 protein [Streptomyces marispadix]|uniref:Peptidase inhibitor family I36 protein n=1 Tax=Streptomyces marispadix TaxID=2922868 RepID=A0ABS9SV09_9ACTN|nr:peptidase inhibitor family I36 protein [Streptomyces marispadix]MCH6160106.1 peptidase inhibitor family I36 protein [Streptomyces marispadix]
MTRGPLPGGLLRGAARGAVLALVSGVLAVVHLASPSTAAAAGPKPGDCAQGELCLWPRPGFHGERHVYERARLTPGRCLRLPDGAGARSFGNRTGRPVTVYESGECAETAEFHTHPSGSWTPEGAYRVRAFKVWER